MDKILVKLLQEAKRTYKTECNALQDLHNEYGFDFCKPIKAVNFTGNFTMKSLERDFGIDFANEKVVVIFKVRGYYECARYTGSDVILPSSGAFDVLSNIYRKGDFNDWRKAGINEVYVIAQDKYFAQDATPNATRRNRNRYNSTFDFSERYEYYDEERHYYGLYKKGVKRCYKNLLDYSYELDKSGYVTDEKQRDLYNRAQKLKAERKAQAYKQMTNTRDMIAKVKTAIDLKKAEIAERLIKCDTADEIEKVDDALSYWSGLRGCYREYERAVERDSNKSFRSPEEFNETIGGIYAKLRKI